MYDVYLSTEVATKGSSVPDQPRTERLNRDRVLARALDLADRGGLEGLTMRSLAAELGVVPMALYKHVANKDQLLGGLVDLVFEEVAFQAVSDDWITAMRDRAASMRQALSRHPWAIGMMEGGHANQGPANLRYHNAVMGTLRGAGFPFRNAVHASSVLDAYIYGFALQERSLQIDTPERAAEVIADQVEANPEAFLVEFPHLAEVAAELGKGDFDFSQEFTIGLDLILEAIDRLRPEWREHTS